MGIFRPLVFSLIFLLICSGCSLLPNTDREGFLPSAKKEKVTIENFKAATDVEKILTEGPGKYGGNRYDQKKVNAELKKFPKGITADEAYNRLVFLLAEDYKPTKKMVDQFDPKIRTKESKTPDGVKAPDQNKKEKKPNVMILLDASGSMAETVAGGIKMDLAKEAVQEYAAKLPERTNVSLRVYGHKGSNRSKDKALSCRSTEEVFPLAPYNEDHFQEALKGFKPTGWTPLAAAMEAAGKDLQTKTEAGTENIVYVVSDGVETCGGNPVDAARTLNQSDIKAEVNIIGFDVDDAGQKALKDVAQAGGGTYETITTKKELQEHFDREYLRLSLEWWGWGARNKNEVYNEHTKKWRELQRWTITLDPGSFWSLEVKERDRLLEAKQFLSDKDILSDSRELHSKIIDRYNKLEGYHKKRYRELTEILDQSRDQRLDEIEKRADGESEKYEQKRNR